MYDYFAILQTLYYFVQYHMGVGEGRSGVVVMAGVLEGKEEWWRWQSGNSRPDHR